MDGETLKTEPVDDGKAGNGKAGNGKATITKGSTVLIEVKHLHGLAAEVIDSNGDQYLLRISEESFEGHLVMFPSSVLVPLSHPKVKQQHKENLKSFKPEQDAPESPLEVSPGQRLAWAYQD